MRGNTSRWAIARLAARLVRRRKVRSSALLLSAVAIGVAGFWNTALAVTDPGLGTAAAFAVLGGSAVTNKGPSVVTGDLGVAPGTSITGMPPLTLNGATHDNDAVAQQAQSDLTTAYNAAAAQPVTRDLTGQDLGNKLLIPGVYHFSSSAQLTGPLTLDGQGAGNALFIFQVGTTLTTASSSTVSLINGASGCNVYWQIGSSAIIGTGTSFRGNLMALTSITVNTGANIPAGRALARNGAVTLDTNVISAPTGCAVSATASPSPTATVSPSQSPSNSASPGITPQAAAAPPRVAGPGTSSPGGPGVSSSPGVPVASTPPDVRNPNTGRDLFKPLVAIAGLMVCGLGMVMKERRLTADA